MESQAIMIKIRGSFPKPRASLVKALEKRFGEKDGKLKLAALMLDAWSIGRKTYVDGYVFALHRQHIPNTWRLVLLSFEDETKCLTTDEVKVKSVSELLGESEEDVQLFLDSLAQ